MTSFAVIVGRQASKSDISAIQESINPLGSLNVKSRMSEESLLCVAQHDQAPCRNQAFVEHSDFSALVAGDVVNHDEIDWSAIRASLVSGESNPGCLNRLRGAFALALIDHEHKKLWIVTDPFAWQPVMASQTTDCVAFSTSIAAILESRLEPATVNDDWVYEFMYYNYGVGPTTPVKGVSRLSAGSIIEYDLESNRFSQRTYCDRLRRSLVLKSGAEAINEAIDAFTRTVPRYFPTDTSVTMGLSAGLDCRAVLAATPERALSGIHSFTFGMPNSSEILESGHIAKLLCLAHTPVLLNDDFLRALPRLASDTVLLSGGLQNVNRSHLLYTYGQLTHDGAPYSVIMTGVSGDHIFRDHIQGWGNVPHIMSADVASQHRNGRHRLDAALHEPVFGKRFTEFNSRIESSLDYVEEEFGEFNDPEAYLSYLMYEAGPRYFGGQLAIANAFSTFRTPYWDPDIVNLGYRLQDATLGFSATLNKKDVYRETRMQATIVAASDKINKLPYIDLPISVFADGNKIAYQAYRAFRKLRSTIYRRSFVYSEDWSLWYRTAMKDEIGRLLGDDSRMRDYVSAEFIKTAIEESDVHWLGKLITAEHTLRLIENRWRRIGKDTGF